MATIDVTRIAGNIGALNALNSLTTINNQLAIHQTRLATGKRINEAADDPAGFSMATTFDIRRQGMATVMGAIGDAKNLLATAEGGLKKIQDILVKMQNKALEATGDTISASEREAIASQLNSFRNEIDDIVKMTKWNDRQLLEASGSSANFLTGVDGSVSNFAFTQSGGFKSEATGLNLTDTYTSANVNMVATEISNAVNTVKKAVAEVGSFTARLSFKEEAMAIARANTESAYNRIMNANMAEEQVEATKFMILQQTATAMLTQANQSPQFLLSLFR